jgi:uncharacterized membrane protein
MGDAGLKRERAMSAADSHEMQRLHAFVDAAFAFAVTLLVVSFDALPRTQQDLITALKHTPSFLASFLMIAKLWREHAHWSRLYARADGAAVSLSLALVAIVLIWIYPLRLLHDSFFAWASGGWLPSEFLIDNWGALRFLFTCYGVLFCAVYLLLVAMHWHAWRHRESLSLDREQRREVWISMRMYFSMAMVGLASAGSAQLLPFERHFWLAPMPGLLYGTIGILAWLIYRKGASFDDASR